MWYVYTCKDQNCVSHAILWDTVWKQKLDFKVAGYERLLSFLNFGVPENTMDSQENKLIDPQINQLRILIWGTNIT